MRIRRAETRHLSVGCIFITVSLTATPSVLVGEVRVMSAGHTTPGLLRLASQFVHTTGRKIVVVATEMGGGTHRTSNRMGKNVLQAQQGVAQRLFVSLTGPDGSPITDLDAHDLTVNVDGVAATITNVEPIRWPTTLQVLVDNGRTNTTPLYSLREGLKALFESMPSGMEMSMYTTAPHPRPIVAPTTDRQQLIEAANRISPDSGAGAFVDALFEAAERIEKSKIPQFPIILMVASDAGRNNVLDRNYQKLRDIIIRHAITTHVIVVVSAGAGIDSNGDGVQIPVGLAITNLTGGRYESITATTRLTTLLPEYGKQIVASHIKQSYQYRVTYQPPANARPTAAIRVSIRTGGTGVVTVDGHIP
jgi:hypothetical protein